jgi:Leucine-rich repeat (LRR) protein
MFGGTLSQVQSIFSVFVLPVDLLTQIPALPRTMSQLQALQRLDVGKNKLQYSDVEFIIESVPQLTALGVDELGLTGQFVFRKSRTSNPTLCLHNISALPRTMSQLQALQKLSVGGNQLQYSDVEFIIESFPQLTTLDISSLGLTGRFTFRKSHTSATSDIRCVQRCPSPLATYRI